MRIQLTLSLLGIYVFAACGSAGEPPLSVGSGGSLASSDGGGGETDTSAGGGGGGGGAVSCPAGSHMDESGSCAAELSAFIETGDIVNPRDHHVTWATETSQGVFLYVLGGAMDMSSYQQSIERALVQPDGSLGEWEVLSDRLLAAGPMVATRGQKVLIASGQRPTTTTKTNLITLGDSGEIVSIDETSPLSEARFHGAMVLEGDYVFATGGLDNGGTSLSTVEVAQFRDEGLSEWSFASELPEPRSHHGLASSGAYLYVTGGLHRENNDWSHDVPYDDVLRATVGEDGALGAWERIATLPKSLSVHSSFVFANHLYLVAGLEDLSAYVRTVQRAEIKKDGSLGEWVELETELPQARGHMHQTPIINGFLYAIAGADDYGSQSASYFAQFQ